MAAKSGGTREKTYTTMSAQGRLTVPAAVRKALDLTEETQLEVVIDGDSFRLRPVVTIPREDLWAYTEEHLQRLRRARAQVAAGELREELPDEADE